MIHEEDIRMQAGPVCVTLHVIARLSVCGCAMWVLCVGVCGGGCVGAFMWVSTSSVLYIRNYVSDKSRK